MRRLALLLLASSLLACYDLNPIAVTTTGFAAAVPVGRTVEAVLSEAGTAALTARVGPGAGSLLGTVTRFTTDTVEIALTEVRTRTGLAYFLQGAVIPVSRNDLAQFRVRELNRPRTAIATALGVTAAGWIIYGVRFGGGGQPEPGGGGGTPALTPP
ncbi:MAG: hypothetical protein P3A32_00320 [Gemmatimonadota bacterium]|nr:hypothetical protein [Gemmatimonadota bacterium]MDQ8146320.1 hypothetical protein [Gemmatimonadota bacterium]MDQ8148256.1 hypothetical protein [Gemmatimonadota bacterium]MDQ8155828.1 hypothetical protein [Gemmatimonadota bacterium]MDQ8175793.1 hypothetical protein [Gemmatimonadota bacterium]